MQNNTLREAATKALAFFEANAEHTSYGFCTPEDPRDFHPDGESCSEAEMEAHRVACQAWNDAGGKPEDWDRPLGSGWNAEGTVHTLRAPWGIGVATFVDPELAELRDVLQAALASTDGQQEAHDG